MIGQSIGVVLIRQLSIKAVFIQITPGFWLLHPKVVARGGKPNNRRRPRTRGERAPISLNEFLNEALNACETFQ